MSLSIESPAGKVILVTGANRGIGLATVLELQKRGARVTAGVREPKKMPSLGDVAVLELDVSDPGSCRDFVDRVEKQQGRIDGLINNAGILLDANTPALKLTEDDLRTEIDVNLIGAIRLCQLVVPGMVERGYGRVVNISSSLGAIGGMGGGYPAYRMTKLALNGFTRILAAELGRESNVKVNCLSPGWVRTDMGGAGASRDPSEPASEIADLVSLTATGPSGGFFLRGEPTEW